MKENQTKKQKHDNTLHSHASYSNTNGFPKTALGETVHLMAKDGDVMNRIVSVGSANRAYRISLLFDKPKETKVISGSRGFTIYSGTFEGVPVSVVTTLMGIANMDFVVRECRSITKGPIAIVRYGTCGSLSKDLPVGSVAVVGKGSVMVHRNPDAFDRISEKNDIAPYDISKYVVPSNTDLSERVIKEIEKALKAKPQHKVCNVLNTSACSFYSSQGRHDEAFDDRNDKLFKTLFQKHPDVQTMEMETYHLLDLARCTSSPSIILASAAMIVLANREVDDVLDPESLKYLEEQGGRAVLQALASFPMPSE